MGEREALEVGVTREVGETEGEGETLKEEDNEECDSEGVRDDWDSLVVEAERVTASLEAVGGALLHWEKVGVEVMVTDSFGEEV